MVSKVILVISLSLSQTEQLLLVTQVWPHSVLFVLYQLGRPTLKLLRYGQNNNIIMILDDFCLLETIIRNVWFQILV